MHPYASIRRAQQRSLHGPCGPSMPLHTPPRFELDFQYLGGLIEAVSLIWMSKLFSSVRTHRSGSGDCYRVALNGPVVPACPCTPPPQDGLHFQYLEGILEAGSLIVIAKVLSCMHTHRSGERRSAAFTGPVVSACHRTPLRNLNLISSM